MSVASNLQFPGPVVTRLPVYPAACLPSITLLCLSCPLVGLGAFILKGGNKAFLYRSSQMRQIIVLIAALVVALFHNNLPERALLLAHRASSKIWRHFR